MIVSCEIMISVNVCMKMIKINMFVLICKILQNKISPIECQNQNTFIAGKIGGSLSNKSGSNTEPVRKRSDFNQALSTLNRLHREAGGQQLRPMPDWKYKQRRPASSASSTWRQWKESWWFLSFQRKSMKRMQAKACDRTGQPVVYRTLAKTSVEWLSRIHSILLQLDRLQLTAVYCNRREV